MNRLIVLLFGVLAVAVADVSKHATLLEDLKMK